MLNGPAGLAGASAMHGYSIRMALVRFRMMIVCKRVLYEKVVYFQRESCQGEGSGRRLSKQEECTESEYMVLRSALYSVYVKDCWLHKKGELQTAGDERENLANQRRVFSGERECRTDIAAESPSKSTMRHFVYLSAAAVSNHAIPNPL